MSAPVIIGNATLYLGDCLEILRTLPDRSVDSIVTDPPYGLGKEPDALAMLADWLASGHHDVKGSGFMGKVWDAFVPQPALWRECLRVLKPGGHLLAFASTRTHDLMTLGLRIAGFEIRDTIMWVYGSGFPKSLDVSKAIDKAAWAEREVVGTNPKWNTSPKAMNPGGGERQAMPAYTAPATDAARQWQGWGTALKPAFEPITVARKPLEGTVAANVLEHSTGALNIDGCRVPVDDGTNSGRPPRTPNEILGGGKGANLTASEHNDAGRWPANLIHDGSDEVVGLFPVTGASKAANRGLRHSGRHGGLADIGGNIKEGTDTVRGHNDNGGSAARFFYCAKASKSDRGEGNNHPTVKPTALMRYLCRMVTPPGGVVLDPFTGSGSTGKAAMAEGFRFIGIEREPNYFDIACRRIEDAQARGG